jgi:hypothetical protein
MWRTISVPTRWLLPLVLLAALVPRAAVFPINENLYGDAIARTEMAEEWARAPHVMTSFGDGAAQFGPLHLYMVGTALRLFDRQDAGRVVSLLFGVLSTIPLFSLTRRYFGARHAAWSCLAFAPWGIHIQASTTAGSEAVALFLMLAAFAAFARALELRGPASFIAPAVLMNLACAVRYDAWMYVALLGVIPAWAWRTRRALRAGIVFVLCSLPYPLFWMYGNAAAHGDPLYPLAYIDAFHRTWAQTATGWQEWWLRAQGIGFWPAMALFTLTPGVAAFGGIGMVVSWRARPETRWVTLCAVVPAAYYAFRTTVWFDFVPLGRFTVVQLALLLPFVGSGFSWCRERWGAFAAHRMAVASAVIAIAAPTALGVYTFRADGTGQTVLRPLSPTSTNARSLMTAADFIRHEVTARGRTVAIDSDASYQDLQVGFFARLQPETAVRMRWPDFRVRVERTPPDFVVRFDHGALAGEAWVQTTPDTLTMAGVTYRQLEGFSPPVRIYQR